MEKKDFRKLYEDLVKSDWFKKAYHDKSLGECPFEIPELNESEDERIRKELIEFIRWSEDRGMTRHDFHQAKRPSEWIAYLEKQKDIIQDKVEQRMEYLWDKLPDAHRVEEGNCTPEEWKALGAYMELEMNFDKGSEEKRKEQKPTEFTHHETNESLKDAVTHQMEDDGDVDDFVRRGIDDIVLKYAELGAKWQKEQEHICDSAQYEEGFKTGLEIGLRKQKEQKPEWSEEDEKMLSDLRNTLSCLMNAGAITFKTKKKFSNWLKSLRPQPKVEWSEEDEKIIGRLRSVVNECAFHNDALNVNGDYCEGDYAKLDSWLKSLSSNLKKKNENVAKLCSNEWSESDKQNINLIISYLDSYIEEHNDTFGADECKSLKYWLKSLRPQPKKELSIEKAIKWLDDTFCFLDNSSGRGRDCEITTHDFDSLEEMYDSFRKAVIVDSEPHWKPSEEQMEALLNTLHPDDPYYPDLKSLYEDLQKRYGTC